MTLNEKIIIFEKQLTVIGDNYAESLKADFYILIGNFNSSNQSLGFLTDLNSKEEIITWIEKLTSRIVMKFDKETESINDFIFDYIELG
nr:hypothetical protein [uncultured Psychroserpens sp.]